MKKIDLLGRSGFDSLHLYENFKVLDRKVVEQLAGGFDWIIENEPDAVLIGGTAVVSYLNSGRALTPDIDFMVSDIDRIVPLLEDAALRVTPLIDGLGITVDELNVDILSSASGNAALNDLIMRTPVFQNIGGVGIKVINPELLFTMKMELGRDKDTDDAMLLLQQGILRKDRFLDYLSQVDDSLGDPGTLRVYSEMMV